MEIDIHTGEQLDLQNLEKTQGPTCGYCGSTQWYVLKEEKMMKCVGCAVKQPMKRPEDSPGLQMQLIEV